MKKLLIGGMILTGTGVASKVLIAYGFTFRPLTGVLLFLLVSLWTYLGRGFFWDVYDWMHTHEHEV